MTIKIGVLGSCVTRDAFNHFFVPNYKEDFEIVISAQRISMISLMQSPVEIDEELLEIYPKNKVNNAKTNFIRYDLNRTLLDELMKKDIDYLVIDNYLEAKIGVICYDDKIITNNWDLKLTKFYNTLSEPKILTMKDNLHDYFELWSKSCDLFFDFLKKNCPNVKIILNKARSLDKVLKENGEVYIDSNFTHHSEVYNPLIEKLDNYICDNFDVEVINFDKNNVLLDENHRWTKGPVHYTKDYYSALIKRIKHIDLAESIDFTMKNMTKTIIKLTYDEIENYEFPLDEDFGLQVDYCGILYCLIVNFSSENHNLICFGPGNHSRDSKRSNGDLLLPPYFDRWSWFKYFDESFIAYADPIFFYDDKITLGWFVGDENQWYLENLANIIEKLVINQKINNKNILFFGSSGGGFTSLGLGTLIKNSKVLINNSQFFIMNFGNFHLDNLFNVLEKGYPDYTREEIVNILKHRLDIIELFKKQDYIPPITYYLNVCSKGDIQHQGMPFINKFFELNCSNQEDLIVAFYKENKEVPHEPMAINRTVKIIKDYSKRNLYNHSEQDFYNDFNMFEIKNKLNNEILKLKQENYLLKNQIESFPDIINSWDNNRLKQLFDIGVSILKFDISLYSLYINQIKNIEIHLENNSLKLVSNEHISSLSLELPAIKNRECILKLNLIPINISKLEIYHDSNLIYETNFNEYKNEEIYIPFKIKNKNDIKFYFNNLNELIIQSIEINSVNLHN